MKAYEVLTVEKISEKAVVEHNYFESFDEALHYADSVFSDSMMRISVYKNNMLVMDVL